MRADTMDATVVPVHGAPAGRLPTRQVLAERLERHLEERRLSVGARRRVGVALPTAAEVDAILSSRTAAERSAHAAALQADVTRTGVTALRCYDVSLDNSSAADEFQSPVQLSDVQVRQDVVRPLNKLMAILALRLRFANVLRTVTAARDSKQAKLESAESGGASGALPLPCLSSLPQLTTLLRELPLPSISNGIPSTCGAAEHASQRLFDVPNARPCHEPFVFRLRHFTPVGLPSFALDIAAQAERETQGSSATAPLGEVAAVPAMEVPQPQSSAAPLAALMADRGHGAVPGVSAPSLARVSADARGSRVNGAAQGVKAGAAETEAYPSVLPSHARGGYATGIMQPQCP